MCFCVGWENWESFVGGRRFPVRRILRVCRWVRALVRVCDAGSGSSRGNIFEYTTDWSVKRRGATAEKIILESCKLLST